LVAFAITSSQPNTKHSLPPHYFFNSITMSSSKDAHSKHPKLRPSDSGLPSSLRQTPWRTGQATLAGDAAEDKVYRSPSDSPSPGLTKEFLARAQQSGRNRTNITTTPTHVKGKKQGDASKGSSSSTDNSDGGVLLNANYDAPGAAAKGQPPHGHAKYNQSPGGRSGNGLSSADAQLNTAPTGGVNVNSPKAELSHSPNQAHMTNIPEVVK
jgi:hypothetical protein